MACGKTQFWTWQVATLGLLKKDGPYWFLPNLKKNWHSTFVVTCGKNEVVEKAGPNLLERFLIL